MINPISDAYLAPNRAEGGNCSKGEDSAKHGSKRGERIFTNDVSRTAASSGDSEYSCSRSCGGNSPAMDKSEEHGGGDMEGDTSKPPKAIEDSHRSDGAGNTSDNPTKLRVVNFRKGKG